MDYFDILPDPLVVLIFNQIADAKGLACCSLLSKRFYSLVPQATNISVRVNSSNPSSEPQPHWNPCPFKHFWSPALFLQYKHYFVDSQCSAAQVLSKFDDVKTLRIEIPSGELGTDDDVLWKWKADFGGKVDRCVILAGLMVDKGLDGYDNVLPESYERNGGSNGVYWNMNSMIAACGRHFFLRKIVLDHRGLVDLVVTDGDGQGVLCMNRDQLEEFRVKTLSDGDGFNNIALPVLNLRLWYAPHLELPNGNVLRGATLIALKPSEQSVVKKEGTDESWVSSAFEEPYGTAARILSKGRTLENVVMVGSG